jgi:hypothetical protein
MAQAGGTDASRLDEAVEILTGVVGAALGVGDQPQV